MPDPVSRRVRRAACLSWLLATAAPVALAACSDLPAAGPTTKEVMERFRPADNPLGVRIVDLTPAATHAVQDAPRPSLRQIDALRTNRPVDRIGPGDVLAIAIYEAGPGLFSQGHATGADSGTAGGVAAAGGGGGTTSETLPHLQVDRSGRIVVPYAGEVKVAGHTPAEVQTIIQDRLAGKASQPQVVVSVVSNDTNVVYVSGDVRSSGRFGLTLSGENLLDLIALAGGPTHAWQDTLVRVTRRGQTAQASLTDVHTEPSENIPVQSQDRIQVDFQPRTYLVFGATGKVAQIPFDQAGVSLAEAVARTGGLDDQRADPKALFLFRFELPSVARALGQPVLPSQARVPVIYHVDMGDPQTYFLIQQFSMRDKDLIYVANARTVQLYKFLQLINSVFTPVVYSRAAAGN